MSVLIEKNTPCPMRDGVVLRSNIYRDPSAGPCPVLLLRTPYDKNSAITHMGLDPLRAVEAGYVVMHQDTRGRFESEGVHSPWLDEFNDGFDTVEWAARQAWSSGVVGAYGVSYHGLASWAAATMAPPSLRAIAPSQAPCDHYDVHWRGGAFELGRSTHWALRVMTPSEVLRRSRALPPAERLARLTSLVDRIDDFDDVVRTTPLSALPDLQGDEGGFPYLQEVYAHPAPHEFHNVRSITGRHRGVRVPALITAGWHDCMLRSDLAHYAAIRSQGATAEAQEQTRLVVGPWTHGPGMHVSPGGEIDYGYRASGYSLDLKEDLTLHYLRWFDRWLKGVPSGGEAPVRIFVMGENRWRNESEWPPARAKPMPWYLQPDRTLAPSKPASGGAPLEYSHDPANPFPTLGGATLLPPTIPSGSVAQNVNLRRPDVVCFTSAALDAPLEVIGPVRVRLWAATSARDADWVVKVCDVHPDGRSFNVCDGIVRASRRERDWDMPRLLIPDEVVAYDIDLSATAMVFLPGHCLQLIVTSSDFPRYDRNPGTGEMSFNATTFVAARNRIFCDSERPSHIILHSVTRR